MKNSIIASSVICCHSEYWFIPVVLMFHGNSNINIFVKLTFYQFVHLSTTRLHCVTADLLWKVTVLIYMSVYWHYKWYNEWKATFDTKERNSTSSVNYTILSTNPGFCRRVLSSYTWFLFVEGWLSFDV